MGPAEFTVLWVRLAKISKDPAQRLSPELQKFVDMLACATIDRMPQFTTGNLCSIIWAASKLKKDTAQSGMFKSFLKAWAAETEPHLDSLELDQLRKVLAAVTRVGFAPSASWKLKAEAALTTRLRTSCDAAACASGAAAAYGACAKTLACCLVSAASLGFGLGVGGHPGHGFREAAAAAAAAAAFGGTAAALGGGAGGVGDAARLACSSLWAAAVLGVPLSTSTIQAMLAHVSAAADEDEAESEGGASSNGSLGGGVLATLTPLDLAQVFWALSKLRYTPAEAELSRLLAATARLLPRAQPELIATILWGLADLEVVPPESWLQASYSAFERQLESAAAEPLQALLHAAATLQLPAPRWSGRLMERLQDVDLRPLPDGNVVDLVMSLHALAMHPPPQLAHRLQDECIKRLAARSEAAAAAPAAGPLGAGAVTTGAQ